MSQTAVQVAVKRILGDKILLGLVIVGLLLVFVGAFCTQDEPTKKTEQPQPLPQTAMAPQTPAPPAAANQLDPKLATDFVTWWLTKAMDFNMQSARASHTEASKWMTQNAGNTFQADYWTQEIQQGVLSGQFSAAFQPMGVQPEALNPDGTVVVGVTGTLVIQQGGPPQSQQVAMDFLVARDTGGLRIAGINNRQLTAAQPAQAAAPY
jgi:hypothetical protein